MEKFKKFGIWNLVIVICLGFGIWSLGFEDVVAATPKPTPLPTSPYTCIQDKFTCVTDNGYSCFKTTSGTCPRGEVCCEKTTNPKITTNPTPQITPFIAPGTNKDTLCQFEQRGKEYHPLRPYAASPCRSHLIPRKYPEAPLSKVPGTELLYQTYSCGKSANPEGKVIGPGVVIIDDINIRFPYAHNYIQYFELVKNGVVNCPPNTDKYDPDVIACAHFKQAFENASHQSEPILCSGDGHSVCFLGKVVFNVTLDYTDVILPILGNTLDRKISDRTKLNNYLSWYLNGAVLHSEGDNLNLSKETEEDRLINFSGPVLKLLSQESLQIFRQKLYDIYAENDDVHLYRTLNTSLSTRFLGNPEDGLAEFATEEDVVSETQPGLNALDQPHQPEIDGRIVEISLRVNSADSRLYFPHLKNSLSMSQYLMSTYKPVSDAQQNPNPDDQAKNMRNLVGQYFEKLQGQKNYTIAGIPFTLKLGDATPVYIEWFKPENIGFFFDPIKVLKQQNVVAFISRNTEVVPYALPPPLLFTNYADRFPSISTQKCDIIPSIGGQGDSLIGGKINTTLTIYQAFKYKPDGLILDTNGTLPRQFCSNIGLTPLSSPQCKDYGFNCTSLQGGICDSQAVGDGTCCYGKCPYNPCEQASTSNYCSGSGSCGSDTIVALDCGGTNNLQCCYKTPVYGVTPKPDPPKCGTWPQKNLNTKGRIAIYVKVPFVEKLYNELIEKPDSLIRRFLPYNAGLPIPTPDPSKPAPGICQRKPNGDCYNSKCSHLKTAATCSTATDFPSYTHCCQWVDVNPNEFLKTGKKTIVGEGSGAKYSAVAASSGATVKDVVVTAGKGGSPALYYPKIGSLFEYLLGAGKDPLNLQCLFRPQGYCQAKKSFDCKNLPEEIEDADIKGQCGICNVDDRLGPLAQKILTAAGTEYNVPASAIFATMLHEGFTWYEGVKIDAEFNDDNVCKWSTPVSDAAFEPLPLCDDSDPNTQPPFGWLLTIFNSFDDAVTTIDPDRSSTSRCNFMDAAFATAKKMNEDVAQAPLRPALQGLNECEGWSLSPRFGFPSSCNWTDHEFVYSRLGYASYCPANPNGYPYSTIPNYLKDSLENYNKYKCS